MRNFITLIIATIILVSCGKTTNDDVSLFSQWNDGKGSFLNFTGAAFNVPFYMTVLRSNGNCHMTWTFAGNQNSGNYTVTNNTCGVNDAGQYAKSDTILTLCSFNNGCSTLYK